MLICSDPLNLVTDCKTQPYPAACIHNAYASINPDRPFLERQAAERARAERTSRAVIGATGGLVLLF